MKKALVKTALAFGALFSAAAFAAEQRVISVGGDVTEIVYALNAQGALVGRDSTSLTPKAAQSLPDVGYMRQLNAEGLLSLRPTLILASELSQPALALEQVKNAGVNIVSVPGTPSLETVTKKIAVVADALGKEQEGEKLIADFNRQLADLPKKSLPTKVLFVMNYGGGEPMAAGQNTAAEAIITQAGGKNAMQGFSRYRPLSQEGVVAAAPDLLLITTTGFQSLGGEEKIWQLPGIKHTPAGQKHRLLVVDDLALLGFSLKTPAVMGELQRAMEGE
ncbi:hemin ABC transporter substrate-binding protein [Leminorella grimontii]|uniref:Hemin ABC transporter substrate-binding protein n=1 Tax=Leminorella grimontii TaxID=82981 RepID=A0AAV5N6X7_9GAMM|nr:hemin ABC transporter substrate-binding protein [Leminorella grimontii]KFC93385.1 periplasmic hemin-binding protein [Leminorella grimontii ATCC 33999 = DSM 5078]GKX57365.1 hemin ABC transporter substrate-binding protein [Leminorella grimontii]VFS54893.1 Hemin-binding periplasmic protein hmuT precursor [Leminorella grimontii]